MGDLLLISGRPGVGKTTLLRRLAQELQDRVDGFYTEEIREHGGRVGFRLVTLDGSAEVFAHVRWRNRPHRVGRYGVDLEVLDRLGVVAIRRAVKAGKVVLIDEIGKMELESAAFRTALEEAIRSPSVVVATALATPHPLVDAIRRRPGCTELPLTPANREEVFRDALQWIHRRCPIPGP
ncbi:MAG: NTPase [Armatimonadetes bacterium]|nr:NTPase [Armatimonadota bacterium]MDW8152678.1 NTPase [Armatimonadota bacterium]